MADDRLTEIRARLATLDRSEAPGLPIRRDDFAWLITEAEAAERLRGRLCDLEWAAVRCEDCHPGGIRICPVCDMEADEAGHTDDCWLAAELA